MTLVKTTVEEYEGRKRKRRKNEQNSHQEADSMPKIRAILAILENRRIDESSIGKRDLEAMYEMIKNDLEEEESEKDNKEQELHVDTFF